MKTAAVILVKQPTPFLKDEVEILLLGSERREEMDGRLSRICEIQLVEKDHTQIPDKRVLLHPGIVAPIELRVA